MMERKHEYRRGDEKDDDLYIDKSIIPQKSTTYFRLPIDFVESSFRFGTMMVLASLAVPFFGIEVVFCVTDGGG
jgi:hypothetical protein